MTTEDFCDLGTCPRRCHSAHVTGITHIHVAASKRGVYRVIWNITPAGFDHPWAQGSKRSLMSPVLLPPSFWWPPRPPVTLLCHPWGPTLLFRKSAPACTAIRGYPVPGAGLCYSVQPAGVPLHSSPVVLPVNHSPSLVSSREGSGSLYHSPTHFFGHFNMKKGPTSASSFLFLNPEWSHTSRIVTKWNKKVCVTDTDYCATVLTKLRKTNWRVNLSVFLWFNHTQTMQDSHLPSRYINFYWLYFLETKHKVQYDSTMLAICKWYGHWIDQ